MVSSKQIQVQWYMSVIPAVLILLSGQKQKDDEVEVSLGFGLLFQPRKVRNG